MSFSTTLPISAKSDSNVALVSHDFDILQTANFELFQDVAVFFWLFLLRNSAPLQTNARLCTRRFASLLVRYTDRIEISVNPEISSNFGGLRPCCRLSVSLSVSVCVCVSLSVIMRRICALISHETDSATPSTATLHAFDAIVVLPASMYIRCPLRPSCIAVPTDSAALSPLHKCLTHCYKLQNRKQTDKVIAERNDIQALSIAVFLTHASRFVPRIR